MQRTKPNDNTYLVHAEYDLQMEVDGDKFTGTVTLDARFEVDPRIEQRALPWGLQFAAKTGFEDIDRALASRIPDRLPLKQVVTVSRRIADGQLITESITTTVTNVHKQEMTDDDFLAPEGTATRSRCLVSGIEFGCRLSVVGSCRVRRASERTAGRMPADRQAGSLRSFKLPLSPPQPHRGGERGAKRRVRGRASSEERPLTLTLSPPR